MPRSAVDEAKARLEGVRNTIVIEGGSSRQRSVAKGLAKVNSDRVVVQDAARPLASVQMVKASLEALDGADGAITAIPAGDTVKRARRSTVEETIPRKDLWLAQTPQAFKTDLLRAAHKRAASEPYDAGDDAELIERYGGTIAIVPGSRLNLKITFGEDFKLAEAIAREL
jgi:2-C-methyl-D-erythritol 4-phosphate cytidylyltransferase